MDSHRFLKLKLALIKDKKCKKNFTIPDLFVVRKNQKRGKLQLFSQNCIMIPHSRRIFADMPSHHCSKHQFSEEKKM
jgi:hypothetical protein